MATLQKVAKTATSTTTARQINAVVVSAGKMQKTVKVRIGEQKWNNHIRKQFSLHRHLLVHDPRSSLCTGDVISISPGWRVSKHVHHVVNSIIAPFGKPIEERPAIPGEKERLKERERKMESKRARKREGRRKLHEEREAELRAKRGEVVEKAGDEIVARGSKAVNRVASEVEVQVEAEGQGEVVQERIEEPVPEVQEAETPPKKRGWFS